MGLIPNGKKIIQNAKGIEAVGVLAGTCEGRIWTCRLLLLGSGTPTQVEFDWSIVIAHEEKFGNVLGFYHTHPSGLTRPSSRDIKTMRVWCDCLGKPLLCAIGVYYPSGEKILCYLFRNYRSRGRKVSFINRKEGHLYFKD